MLLEAYYEPRFRASSHGFRPGRGCHTALSYIKHKFKGTAWFIEGDIRGCFDNIDHDVLMDILSRDIHDGRLLNLIRMCLKASVVDGWRYHKTYSGTPQGGVISPLLANIYLHELDVFIEDELIPQHTRGKRRRGTPEYRRFEQEIERARERGNRLTVQELERRRRQIPSQDTRDPHYRRLKYCRYADDFILGFIGPRSEAEAIETAIGEFLQETLRLKMGQDKTLVTHARTEHAQFLGYAISTYHADHKMTRRARTGPRVRSINGQVRLGVPYGLVTEMAKRYQQNGKPIHDAGLLFRSDAHIIDTYQRRYRGIAEYYKYAIDRHHLGKLKFVMQVALTKTLAHKHKISVSRVYRKYRGTLPIDGREYKVLQVEVPTSRGTRIVHWGAIPLTVIKPGVESIADRCPHDRKWQRTDLIHRLQADRCELCGSRQNCEVHHVRKLADLKRRWAGRREKPRWVKQMIATHRKTLVVCHQCHVNIHAGRPSPSRRIGSSGEPDDAKVSRPVRRGAVGKVPVG
jgi:group II intron reverse transcriptase/maturase